MNQKTQCGLTVAVLLFVGIPVLFYLTGEVPRRTILKESLSLVALLAFCLMIAQFFLNRLGRGVFREVSLAGVVKFHKYSGYFVGTILLIHPLLIVLPRYYEAGIEPLDAFLIMITTFQSSGVVTGIAAWWILFSLVVTSLFRKQMFKKYSTWRAVHGGLSALFLACAAWHAIHLGRHMSAAFSSYLIVGASIGIGLLVRTYMPAIKTKVAEEATV